MYNVYDIVHPNVVTYAQKCRNTHTCDINVSVIQCENHEGDVHLTKLSM